jgi:hypothetical protein
MINECEEIGGTATFVYFVHEGYIVSCIDFIERMVGLL